MCCPLRSSGRLPLRLAAAAIVLMALIPAAGPDAAAETVRVSGTLTRLRVDNAADHSSGGTIAVDSRLVFVPGSVLIDVADASMNMQDLFAHAPAACRRTKETGLVVTDICRSRLDDARTDRPPTAVRVVATRGADGNLVASKVTFVAAP